ncbi:MAG: aspartate carbamoyltransferase [Clostridiales bacterium]|jgi:aspartate carbamoyltransferase catalytic subunit|nr:aspartate carbamoyltransferase [Clostridiales bacterium]
MRHVIEPTDLSINELDELIALAEDIRLNPVKYADCCKGKILAALFYEASTRTRLSFESAMLSLGGSVIGFASADASSAVKGESVADTVRTVSNYADICAIRHPKEGSALVASQYSGIPVINAGDGGHEHPTQTLTDLLTIHTIKRTLSGLTIGFCGDLKFGRTVHSLVKALSLYPNNRFLLVSPNELRAPDYIRATLANRGCEYQEGELLDTHIRHMDVLYMTRVQRERFFNEEDYLRLKDSYILNMAKLVNAKSDLSILHPLPRVNEISMEVDGDPRAQYFNQVRFGKLIRMALILKLLEIVEWRGGRC